MITIDIDIDFSIFIEFERSMGELAKLRSENESLKQENSKLKNENKALELKVEILDEDLDSLLDMYNLVELGKATAVSDEEYLEYLESTISTYILEDKLNHYEINNLEEHIKILESIIRCTLGVKVKREEN